MKTRKWTKPLIRNSDLNVWVTAQVQITLLPIFEKFKECKKCKNFYDKLIVIRIISMHFFMHFYNSDNIGTVYFKVHRICL